MAQVRMRTRSTSSKQRFRAGAAALLLIACVGPAWAVDVDNFFQDLESGAAVALSPEPPSPVKAAAPSPLAPPLSGTDRASAPPAGIGASPPAAADKKTADVEKRGQPAAPLPLGANPSRGGPVAPSPGGLDALDPEPADVAHPAAGKPADPLAQPVPAAATAPPAKPLAPLNAAVSAALDKRDAVEFHGAGAAEKRKQRKAIAAFYAARGFAPLWTEDGRPIEAVTSVVARLGRAEEDGLGEIAPAARFTAQGAPAEIADSDIALTEAVVSYARQATGGRIDPQTISPLIGLRPVLADAADVLAALAAGGEGAGDKLQALNPNEPRYLALRDKLVRSRADRVLPPGAKPIPAGPTLHIGMRDPRVLLLRERFHLDAGFGSKPDAARYGSDVAQAVAAYQRSAGLPPSGALTADTADALSGRRRSSLDSALITNMEMWRWMPRVLGHDRIEVNIPDFLVSVFHDDAIVSQHRVVVGKTETPTPLFSNAMKYIIVNPYWNVPQSIIKKELLPKGGGDLSYLERQGYSVSWHSNQATVKQLPGDRNALGRIKFLFPNDYSVYLHDTPSKALFSASKRAFSHGCVRVDQPFSFAETVLGEVQPEGTRGRWSEQRLEGLIGEKERYLNLSVPLPIHIEYFTASVDPETGAVKLREDVYGYARAIAAALGQSSEPAAEAERQSRLVAQHVRHRTPVPSPDDAFDPR